MAQLGLTESGSEEKNLDDRASVLSVNTNKSQKLLDYTLPQVVDGIPFKKFRSALVPMTLLIVFFVVFLTSIMVIYRNATSSITILDQRIQTLNLANWRFSDVAEISTGFMLVRRFELRDLRDSPVNLRYISNMYNDTKSLLTHNDQLENMIQNLTKEENDYFFEQDVRLFLSDYYEIPDAPYTLADSFSASRRMGAVIQQFYNIYFPEPTDTLAILTEYIFGNLYNDFWIANKAVGEYMKDTITA